ncbi:MAG TPA: DUF2071 domain-containing protein [Gaiellaceae bacterium]
MNPLAWLATSARQSAALADTAHRPWPLPARRWLMAQTLKDALFAHWPVDEEEVRPLVPDALELQTFAGSAWLGIAAFRVTALRLRGTLPVPRLSSFLQLNVRTYVTAGGKPGIWFFSLDTESLFAVQAARRAYGLPFHQARMSASSHDDWIEYESTRVEPLDRPFVFSGRCRPHGVDCAVGPGSLEEFLTERYCLYASDRRGAVRRAEIHRGPWRLQKTDVEIELNTMTPPGVRLPDEAPLAHFAAEQDVVIWPLERVAGA